MANLYELAGPDGLQISYRSDGIGGPELVYTGPTFPPDNTETLTFIGNGLTIQDSAIGVLITVLTFHTIDSLSTQFTLVVPNVNQVTFESQPINTIGIFTHNRFILPEVIGQTQSYSVVNLEGSVVEWLFPLGKPSLPTEGN